MHTMIRHWCIGLEVLVAAGAGPFGLLMIAHPSGSLIGLEKAWLEDSPFTNYLVPGLYLTFVIGFGMLVVAVAEFVQHRFAPVFTLLGGINLVAFEAIQIAFDPLSFLQFSLQEPGWLSLGLACGGYERNSLLGGVQRENEVAWTGNFSPARCPCALDGGAGDEQEAAAESFAGEESAYGDVEEAGGGHHRTLFA